MRILCILALIFLMVFMSKMAELFLVNPASVNIVAFGCANFICICVSKRLIDYILWR